FFTTLMALLRLDRQCSDRAGVEAPEGDRLARFLAIAIGAFADALKRGVDLGDQLALTVAGAQLDGAVGFGRCTIGEIGKIGVLLLKNFQRLARFAQYIVLPGNELAAEIGFLPLVHEGFVLSRDIIGFNTCGHSTQSQGRFPGALYIRASAPAQAS